MPIWIRKWKKTLYIYIKYDDFHQKVHALQKENYVKNSVITDIWYFK